MEKGVASTAPGDGKRARFDGRIHSPRRRRGRALGCVYNVITWRRRRPWRECGERAKVLGRKIIAVLITPAGGKVKAREGGEIKEKRPDARPAEAVARARPPAAIGVAAAVGCRRNCPSDRSLRCRVPKSPGTLRKRRDLSGKAVGGRRRRARALRVSRCGPAIR